MFRCAVVVRIGWWWDMVARWGVVVWMVVAFVAIMSGVFV